MHPTNSDFATVVTQSFARQGVMALIGARLDRVEPGHVVISVPWSETVAQQQGYFHGGIIGTIGDSAGGYAALTLMPAASEVVTVEYKINFVRPASGRLLIAEGRILRAGKTMTVARIDVGTEDGSAGRTLVAALQATFMRVPADNSA